LDVVVVTLNERNAAPETCSDEMLIRWIAEGRTRITGDIVRRIVFAVFRFRTNSNLVGCSIGTACVI